MIEGSLTNQVIVGSNSVESSKEFLDIQATIECGFTLKGLRDTIGTCNRSLMPYFLLLLLEQVVLLFPTVLVRVLF